MLCWPVGHHLTCLLPTFCLRHLGTIGMCSGYQRCLNHCGVGPLSGLCLPGQIFSGCWCCLPSKVNELWQWYFQAVSSGNALRGSSEILSFNFS